MTKIFKPLFKENPKSKHDKRQFIFQDDKWIPATENQISNLYFGEWVSHPDAHRELDEEGLLVYGHKVDAPVVKKETSFVLEKGYLFSIFRLRILIGIVPKKPKKDE